MPNIIHPDCTPENKIHLPSAKLLTFNQNTNTTKAKNIKKTQIQNILVVNITLQLPIVGYCKVAVYFPKISPITSYPRVSCDFCLHLRLRLRLRLLQQRQSLKRTCRRRSNNHSHITTQSLNLSVNEITTAVNEIT